MARATPGGVSRARDRLFFARFASARRIGTWDNGLFEAVVAARVEDLVAEARRRADAAGPGEAFLGFLALLTQEAGVKGDLSDALVAPLTVATSLREDLHARWRSC